MDDNHLTAGEAAIIIAILIDDAYKALVETTGRELDEESRQKWKATYFNQVEVRAQQHLIKEGS